MIIFSHIADTNIAFYCNLMFFRFPKNVANPRIDQSTVILFVPCILSSFLPTFTKMNVCCPPVSSSPCQNAYVWWKIVLMFCRGKTQWANRRAFDLLPRYTAYIVKAGRSWTEIVKSIYICGKATLMGHKFKEKKSMHTVLLFVVYLSFCPVYAWKVLFKLAILMKIS